MGEVSFQYPSLKADLQLLGSDISLYQRNGFISLTSLDWFPRPITFKIC